MSEITPLPTSGGQSHTHGNKAYLDTIDQDLSKTSGVEFNSLKVSALQAIIRSQFGYSSSYWTVQLGSLTSNNSNISLGADITGNTSGKFSGKNIVIPNNSKIIAPNASNNDYVGILRVGTDDKLYIGGGGVNAGENITVDSSTGRVGIGTTIPSNKLVVYSNTSADGILISGSDYPRLRVLNTTYNTEALVQSGVSKIYFGTVTNHQISFKVNNSEKAVIDTSGNVGIGTTSPSHKLEVNGDASFKRPVLAKTANYTVQTTDSNTFFTNEGATAGVTFTLPTASAGLTYTFYVQTAQTVTIQTATGNTIRTGSTVTSAGGTMYSSNVGNLVKIVAINSTEWIVETIVGSWSTT